MMAKRFPACDRRHPDRPSRILVRGEAYGRGRTYCSVCNGIRKDEARQARRDGVPLSERRQPYGVIPLKWKPPEIGEFTDG